MTGAHDRTLRWRTMMGSYDSGSWWMILMGGGGGDLTGGSDGAMKESQDKGS